MTTACQLEFSAPLRLIDRGKLVVAPSLTDVVVAACRRIAAFLADEHQNAWKRLVPLAIAQSRQTPTKAWIGSNLDLHRYSGRQRAEVDLRGVSGVLGLPRGAGPIWPLLLAATWLHVGKGTVMGLGEVRITPLPSG